MFVYSYLVAIGITKSSAAIVCINIATAQGAFAECYIITRLSPRAVAIFYAKEVAVHECFKCISVS